MSIENARLYARSVRRERWLGATQEITRQLLAGQPGDEGLALIARVARTASGATIAAVATPPSVAAW